MSATTSSPDPRDAEIASLRTLLAAAESHAAAEAKKADELAALLADSDEDWRAEKCPGGCGASLMWLWRFCPDCGKPLPYLGDVGASHRDQESPATDGARDHLRRQVPPAQSPPGKAAATEKGDERPLLPTRKDKTLRAILRERADLAALLAELRASPKVRAALVLTGFSLRVDAALAGKASP